MRGTGSTASSEVLALLLAASLYGDPLVAFTLTDPRISESSGLVSSSLADGVLFTHNDSGDTARFFAVDGQGRTLTTYNLPGVQARDWEDLARGPDERGRSSLWLGDIGDNNARRDNGVLVHRVAEPVPGRAARVTTERPTSFRLRYPDGPGDAETLLVHPQTGRLYVVTKPLAGPAQVYAAPARLDPEAPNLLALVGEVPVRRTGTAGGPAIGALAQLLVTGGDISPDGGHLAVRTYTDVYEYAVVDGDVAAALRTEPEISPLPPAQQGEGLAYSRDGSSLLTSTEGRSSPVHRLTRRLKNVESGNPTVERDAWRPVVAAGVIALLVAGVAVRRRRRSFTDR